MPSPNMAVMVVMVGIMAGTVVIMVVMVDTDMGMDTGMGMVTDTATGMVMDTATGMDTDTATGMDTDTATGMVTDTVVGGAVIGMDMVSVRAGDGPPVATFGFVTEDYDA